ncbi:MAG: UDP-N-acetylmuramoyl-L-alanyl-D-glutamate--2,6-diaminopimelate ligase [Bacteroidota bacterium]|nr:UDP-N-acetylmuramoyl-L-alanyl-D-glutamate--2,6-diaminopimelate ligase [Bacteroidota bacterium]
MKISKQLLSNLNLKFNHGNIPSKINHVTFDSRNVAKGDMFVAIPGSINDGHNYIDNAIDDGAVLIVSQKEPEYIRKAICYLIVDDTRKSLSIIAAEYYNYPAKHITIIGVTGTNGKTTIVHLLFQLFNDLDYKTGIISTIGNRVHNKYYQTSHTTPNILEIHRLLAEMVKQNCQYCFMEVSSHAIHQYRIYGLEFSGGVFSNITTEHLDYHKTFNEYLEVKKSFFDLLPKESFALTNDDDINGSYIISGTHAKKYTYSIKSVSDFRCNVLQNQFDGMLLKINNRDVWVNLIGDFNAYNILAVYSTAKILGIEEEDILIKISSLESPNGRFQQIISDNGSIGIIDYAHTDDALRNILKTINSIKSKEQNIITVIGCGGDRDKSKRSKMGKVAYNLSFQVVFTSDNPRSESPDAIIRDMLCDLNQEQQKKVIKIIDRKEAIKTACKISVPGDIILVAGKGHEQYQEIHGNKILFNDRNELVKSLT